MNKKIKAKKKDIFFIIATPQDDNIPVKFICYGSSQFWQTNTLTTKTTPKPKNVVQTVITRKDVETPKSTKQIANLITTLTTSTTTTVTTTTTISNLKSFFTIHNFPTTKVDSERVLIETTTMNSLSNTTYSTKVRH